MVKAGISVTYFLAALSDNVYSYCVTASGNIWIAVGSGTQSVIRLSPNNTVGIAVINNNVSLGGTPGQTGKQW